MQTFFRLPNSYLVEVNHRISKDMNQQYLKQHQSHPCTSIPCAPMSCLREPLHVVEDPLRSLSFVIKILYDGLMCDYVLKYRVLSTKYFQSKNEFEFVYTVTGQSAGLNRNIWFCYKRDRGATPVFIYIFIYYFNISYLSFNKLSRTDFCIALL